MGLTNHRIRRLPQARLVRGTSRAIVNADHFNVMHPDREGRSDLHYAALEGDLPAVQRILATGADVNLQDKRGWTPLHFAAQACSVDVTRYLLAHGARFDLEDSFGNTPLHRATFETRGDGSVIQVLREAGADPKKPNKSGVSALSLSRTVANFDVAQFYADIIDA
jgi:ankyrin repeat protein